MSSAEPSRSENTHSAPRVGISLLGFISDDPKGSRALKSVNGLYCFQAIATAGSKIMLDLGMHRLAWRKFGFIRCA